MSFKEDYLLNIVLILGSLLIAMGEIHNYILEGAWPKISFLGMK